MSLKVSSVERLVALMTLGIVAALRTRSLTIDEANHLLFSPHTMALLRDAGARDGLVALIHAATELEDIAELAPAELDTVLSDLEQQARQVLADAPAYDYREPKWLSLVSGAPGRPAQS